MKAYYYEAPGTNPYENLAIEEFFTKLVTDAKEETALLYFWQNEDSVVFGRNQNAACECNLSKLQEFDVHPVRRKTGGGAVFHDLHNLNFTFVVSKSCYQKEASMQMLADALRQMDIPVSVSGRNDLEVEGCKISGSAYAANETMALHHGTLLLAADLHKMEQLLTVNEKKLQSKGVKSVRSRVKNLSERYPQYSISDYKRAIRDAFTRHYQIKELMDFTATVKQKQQIRNLTQFYADKEWIFGYDKLLLKKESEKFSWGNCTLCLVKTGEEQPFYDFYSDTLYSMEFQQARSYICSKQKKASWQPERIQDENTLKIYEDLAAWLQKIFKTSDSGC